MTHPAAPKVRLRTRLANLSLLQPGWHGEGSYPPDPAAVEATGTVIDALAEPVAQRTTLACTRTGDLVLETRLDGTTGVAVIAADGFGLLLTVDEAAGTIDDWSGPFTPDRVLTLLTGLTLP